MAKIAGFKKWREAGMHGGCDAGQALVETALSMTLLALLLMGAAEFAQAAYVAIEVSNAAKAAVQYGARTRSAATDTTGIGTAAVNDAYNVSGLTVTSVSRSCSCANTAYVPSSCSDNTTCLNGNTIMEETLTVQTKASFSPLTRLPWIKLPFTLYGQASQKVLNQ